MQIATQYAKALFESAEPKITTLEAMVKRRGHEKLLPQIVREYERLSQAKERITRAKAATPEREQTRILFELYRKLTS